MKKQSVIFWEDIVSPHQSAFIRALSQKIEVKLIVEKEMEPGRVSQGWSIPDMGRCEIVINPTLEEAKNILHQHPGSYHIFDGIASIKLVRKIYNEALKYNYKVGVISEPFNWQGLKGKVRLIRGILEKCLHNKTSFILAIGNRGRWWYEKCGYEKSKVFDWAYFVEPKPKVKAFKQAPIVNSIVNLAYVGQLIQRKGVDTLLKELAQLQHLNWSLTIVGDGIERKKLEEYSNNISNKIEFKGNISNEKVFEIFSNADLMLCPSRFDGWGAVVNEALTVGTPVLVSNNCGASVLVDGVVTGESFSFEMFGTVLEKWIIKRELKQYRNEIIDWTHSVMNGDVASDYFLDILKSVDEGDNKSKAPWFK